MCENDSFVVVVPFWALWPFETLLLAKTHLRSLADFLDKNKGGSCVHHQEHYYEIRQSFQNVLPYSMGLTSGTAGGL